MAPTRRRRSSVRLLFDENISPRVARALAELGYAAAHVGGVNEPPLGSTDEEVLAHARRTNQVIVTSNHDMIELCAEEAESLVWVDPYGRRLNYRKMVLRCFEGIEDWEIMLSAGQVCVHSLATRTNAISLSKAAVMARRRIAKAQARERRIQHQRIERQSDRLDL